TGGIATEGGFEEADVAALAFRSMGLGPDRYRLERDSANTYGNAVESYDMLQPGDAPWILVTSAYHMPRSVGVFRAAGWTVVPYPVGYRTKPDLSLGSKFEVSVRLRTADLAVHEWIGLAAYRVRGYTDALFPGPASGLRDAADA